MSQSPSVNCRLPLCIFLSCPIRLGLAAEVSKSCWASAIRHSGVEEGLGRSKGPAPMAHGLLDMSGTCCRERNSRELGGRGLDRYGRLFVQCRAGPLARRVPQNGSQPRKFLRLMGWPMSRKMDVGRQAEKHPRTLGGGPSRITRQGLERCRRVQARRQCGAGLGCLRRVRRCALVSVW